MRRSRLMAFSIVAALGGVSASAAQDAAGRAIASRLPQDYMSLRQRPLFAPDRKPPAPPPVAEPTPIAEPAPEPKPVQVVAAPHWELIGVVRSPRITSAVFRSPAEAATFSLRPGESRNGWTLAEVGRFEVSLRNGDGHARMRFPDGTDGSVSLPPDADSAPPGSDTTQVIDDNGAAVTIPNPPAE